MSNQFQTGILPTATSRQARLLKALANLFASSELVLQYLLKVGHV